MRGCCSPGERDDSSSSPWMGKTVIDRLEHLGVKIHRIGSMIGWEVDKTVKETTMSGYSLPELRSRVTSWGERRAAPERGNTGREGRGHQRPNHVD